ncbi:MAG: hypothetical protein GYB18_02010 [Oceanospirillales bacterium]|nr:hypothetical protein [Oceanospirillales bacterium]
MSAIGNRINEAISKVAAGDFENALIQVSIAIDASGKKKRPNKSVGVRYKEFIRDHESLIYFMIVGIKSSAKPVMSFPTMNGETIDIAHAYYKSVRNGLLHDGEIGDKLEILEGNVIRYKDEKISISATILWALILAVVCDPINSDEKLEGKHTLTTSRGEKIHIHESWGKQEQVYGLTGYNNV